MSIYKPHGKWILTDSDCCQVRRQFYEGCDDLWQLTQIREVCDGCGNYWYETISQMIDLKDYTDEEIEEMLNCYGYDADDTDLDAGILAEMFFESCDDYDIDRHVCRDDAIRHIERMTGLSLHFYMDEPYPRTILLDVMESYVRMIERNGEEYPTVVLGDIKASITGILKMCKNR